MEGAPLNPLPWLALLAAVGASSAADGWPADELAPLDSVSDGELRWIAPPPATAVLHADTRLEVTARSKRDGWVAMRQCYRHLDPVERTGVVYAYREMRGLRVTDARGISAARVVADGVELSGVGDDAALCVAAEVRLLRARGGGRYRIDSGPYHRRFLDGYYPFHVGLTVAYAGSGLHLERVTPAAAPGFEVTREAGAVTIEAWFSGRLTIGLELADAPAASDQLE